MPKEKKTPFDKTKDILLTNINFYMYINGLDIQTLSGVMGMSKTTFYRRKNKCDFDIPELVNMCKAFRLIDKNGNPEIGKLFNNLLERS